MTLPHSFASHNLSLAPTLLSAMSSISTKKQKKKQNDDGGVVKISRQLSFNTGQQTAFDVSSRFPDANTKGLTDKTFHAFSFEINKTSGP